MLTAEEKLKLDALHRQHDKELQDVLDEKLYKDIFGDTIRNNVRGVMYATFGGAIVGALAGLASAGILFALAGPIGGAVGAFITTNIWTIAPAMTLLFGYKGSDIARSFIPQLSATAGAMASGIAHKEIRERAMEREKLLEKLSPEQEEKIRAALAKTPMPQPEKKKIYHWKVGLTWGLIAAVVGAIGVAVAAPAVIPAIVASTGFGLEALLPGVVAPTAAQIAGAVAAAQPAFMAIGATIMGSIGMSFGLDRSIFQKINFLSDHAATGTMGSVFVDAKRAKQLEPEISRYEAPRPKAFGLTDDDMKELSSKRHGNADFRKRYEEERTARESGTPQVS